MNLLERKPDTSILCGGALRNHKYVVGADLSNYDATMDVSHDVFVQDNCLSGFSKHKKNCKEACAYVLSTNVPKLG